MTNPKAIKEEGTQSQHLSSAPEESGQQQQGGVSSAELKLNTEEGRSSLPLHLC